MNLHAQNVVPFSLKDAPSFIEKMWPSGTLSFESKKERDAKQGQTLSVLGAYWKGRKPLVLVKACILGALLPATDDAEADLRVFDLLMGVADSSLIKRLKQKKKLDGFSTLTYDEKIDLCFRPEEMSDDLYDDIWPFVNKHLGTSAFSIADVVEQLGLMRFGRKPVIGDTFSGGGSIPFEAARIGCDAFASDLNPIACMLTWGGFNVIGSSQQARIAIESERQNVVRNVELEIKKLGIESDTQGNQAKAYLYCLETTCPETGWLVPVATSWIVSKRKRCIAELVPIESEKKYEIKIRSDVSDAELSAAALGTLQNKRLVHPANPNPEGVSISTIRGDYKDKEQKTKNRLRPWTQDDFKPRQSDIFQERLYCIQWITKETINTSRQETFFAAPTPHDLANEARVEGIVAENLASWQESGLVPDMAIEPGEKTSEPIFTRGWTFWHHLFTPRQLHFFALLGKESRTPFGYLALARLLDRSSKINSWIPSETRADAVANVFQDQSLKVFYNYGAYSSFNLLNLYDDSRRFYELKGSSEVTNAPAEMVKRTCDLFITDPPYADAVSYHEITEFFISWLRKNPPKEFVNWNWDSRRQLAIKGKGEEFRANMVKTYRAMAERMPDNGIQIVMFTHQDGKVWSDMAQIFWGAGLQVMADWYIATETTSELKKGGYVQGTHIIVLRKRKGSESGYSDEIAQEVKEEVAHQIEDMVGLNQNLKGHGRSENLFNDADMQMAGYAAALRVLTKYVKIDGKDMTVEATRPRKSAERTVIDDIIEYAVQVANEHLVPEGIPGSTWRKLTQSERFYLKMMDIESTGAKKIDNYQNFAKAFRVGDYTALMSSLKANDAGLKTAAEFGKRQMGDDDFGRSLTRAILYALWEMNNQIEDDLVMSHLRDLVENYFDARGDLIAIAKFIADKRTAIDRDEAQSAQILAEKIRNEKLG